jgi:hypothetical protein
MLELGDSLSYTMLASDNHGISSWSLNHTTYFTIDSMGHLTSIGMVPVGVYHIEVQVRDLSSNMISAVFTVTVVDTTTPTWVESPQNLVIEYGDDFVCDLNATDLSEIEWRVDDTDRFSVDWSGRVRTQELLAPGVYGLRIYVSDIYENTLMASILIEIVDTTPPEWSITIVDQSIEYGEPFEYQLSAFDLSGIDQWSLNNTESFDINYLGLITSIGILEPGVYGLTVTASDLYGNEVSAEFSVHVTEVTMTTTTTTTTTSTTTTTTATTTTTTTTTTTLTVPPLNPMFTLIIGFSIGGIAVVIVTILALRRKAKA